MNKKFSEIIKLFNSGVNEVKPSTLIKSNVWLEENVLNIASQDNTITKINLTKYENIIVIGAGKASAEMASQTEKILCDKISSGLIVTKYGFGVKLNRIKLIEANHPIPDENGLKAAEQLVEICNNATEKDLIINLLSGGASALIPLPSDGISLTEKIIVTNQLLESGATIEELNIIRRHLSKIKGGGLLEYIYPAKVMSLILSDVIGDKLDIIGSGITVPAKRDMKELWDIIEKHNFQNTFPKSVIAHLQSEKSKDEQDNNNVKNVIIGNNIKALYKIKADAEQAGYETKIINTSLEGEAKTVGKQIAENAILFANEKADKDKKYCFLNGGETTVNIKGNGKGGRNQELVLASAIVLEGSKGITILSGGTDGNDGPTNAAGAVCDGGTIQLAEEKGLNAEDYLERNDSYNYFKAIDSLVITGPTRTNVMDIQIVLIEP
ncbi:MAG: glycerate kinase [Bacteroidota bacterium]